MSFNQFQLKIVVRSNKKEKHDKFQKKTIVFARVKNEETLNILKKTFQAFVLRLVFFFVLFDFKSVYCKTIEQKIFASIKTLCTREEENYVVKKLT